MSAIARYFIHRGMVVAGYDKTPSKLTTQLEKEGMLIHYEENVGLIPMGFKVYVLDDESQIGGIIDEIRAT